MSLAESLPWQPHAVVLWHLHFLFNIVSPTGLQVILQNRQHLYTIAQGLVGFRLGPHLIESLIVKLSFLAPASPPWINAKPCLERMWKRKQRLCNNHISRFPRISEICSNSILPRMYVNEYISTSVSLVRFISLRNQKPGLPQQIKHRGLCQWNRAKDQALEKIQQDYFLF